ncbi:MAG: phage tail protein [Mycoplasmoidaceae bacterium]|nr:phage tail protein [Mycoplasmoidaceae bacterium]
MAGKNTFGGTVTLTGESEYRKALSNISAQLGVVSSQMGKVTAEFGKNDKSVSGLTAKEDVLNKRLEVQQQKVATLRGALENSKEMYGENDTKTLKWQQSLNKAEADVIKTTKEIDSLGNEMENAGEQAEKSGDGFTVFKGILANLGTQAITGALNGLKNLGSSIINVGKQAITSYADYEQLVGGVETLFKDSSGIVQNYANNAYKTAGLSANEYMETVTSFSASLLQSLDGDTKKSAEVADMAITDMSDNANKMGTDMSMIQNAYQGFAKQNYTMLDNLKLGYGGTKGEMERLLSDAEKLSGQKYDISNLNDVYEAIHVVQDELGITGTTAKEASTTIEGSLNTMKSAWANMLTGIADDNADFESLTSNLIDSVMTVVQNLLPRVHTVIEGMGNLVSGFVENLVPQLVPMLADAIAEMTPTLFDSLTVLIESIVGMLPQLTTTVIQLVKDLATTLADSLPTLIPIVIQSVIDIAMALLDNIDLLIDAGINLIMGLADGLINALPQLIDKIPVIIDKLIMAITNNLPKIIEAGIKLAIKLAEGLIKAIPSLIKAIPKIILSLVKGFGNYVSNFKSIGLNIVKGILNGFLNVGSLIWDTVKKFGNKIINSIKSFFKIHSPAQNEQLVWSSKMIAQGIGVGFINEMDKVSKDMAEALPTDFDIQPNITTGFGNNRLVVGYDGENESKSSNFTTIINNNSKFTSPAENARLVRKEYELYQLKYGGA